MCWAFHTCGHIRTHNPVCAPKCGVPGTLPDLVPSADAAVPAAVAPGVTTGVIAVIPPILSMVGIPEAFGLLAPLPTGLVAREAVGVLVIRRESSLEIASARTAGSTGGGLSSPMSELDATGRLDSARGRVPPGGPSLGGGIDMSA